MNPLNEEALKRVLVVLIILLIMALTGIAIVAYRSHKSSRPEQSGSSPQTYALSPDMHPGSILLMRPLEHAVFYDESGNEANLDAYKGNTLALSYWSSRCPSCRSQLELMRDNADMLAAYGDVKWLYINRTDCKKETLQSAAGYAREQGIYDRTLYDTGRRVYDALGIRKIPSTIFLDEKGLVRHFHTGEIKTIEQMASLLNYVKYGACAAAESFVKRTFMQEDGGILSFYNTEENSVLSESQGLMLEYALLKNDRKLFECAYGYARERLRLKNGLFSWRYQENEGLSPVNSLLDDLRILRSLDSANSVWGGYDTDIHALKSALLSHLTQNGFPVDYYDSKQKRKSSSFTLCYADFEALRLLGSESLYTNSLSLVEGGYIGDAFPLYYSAYNYAEKDYDRESSLHTAEALITLYHLAREGRLKGESLDWLRDRMEENGPAARYSTEGAAIQGYDYSSCAVFALIGMIAHEQGDDELFTAAVTAMERFRTNSSGDEFDGAFGSPSDSGLHVFDQLMPMILYASSGM